MVAKNCSVKGGGVRSKQLEEEEEEWEKIGGGGHFSRNFSVGRKPPGRLASFHIEVLGISDL